MLTHNTQIQMAVVFPITNHIITAVIICNIAHMNGIVLIQTKGGVVQTLHSIHGVGIIAICQNTVGGNLGKLMERCFNILQIFEVVQMVCLNIQNNRQCRIEIQEGIAILTAFQNDRIAIADTVPRMQQRQITADHNRGITFRFHHDMGHHGSGGGFTVGTGNADCVLIGLHDLSPCLCALKNRNTGSAGSRNLRIIVMCRSRTDDTIRATNVAGFVADGDVNTFSDEFICGNRRIHIRTCN